MEKNLDLMRSIQIKSHHSLIRSIESESNGHGYKSDILPKNVPRGSIVHNKKYARFTMYNRYRKIYINVQYKTTVEMYKPDHG